MAWSGKHPTSEIRLVAAPADDWARIELALAHAESHVARMQCSPATQHLKNVLESCRRTLAGWGASPPTGDELDALRDRVMQTLQVARTTSPTLRLRRLA
jgi:hypothetical protein